MIPTAEDWAADLLAGVQTAQFAEVCPVAG